MAFSRDTFGRNVRVTMGAGSFVIAENIQDQGQRIAFHVKQTRNLRPDFMEVDIWGLSGETRSQIAAQFKVARKQADAQVAKGNVVQIGRFDIFTARDGGLGPGGTTPEKLTGGDLTEVIERGDIPNEFLSLKGADGWLPWRKDFVNESFANIDIGTVMQVLGGSVDAALNSAGNQSVIASALTDAVTSRLGKSGKLMNGRTIERVQELFESMKIFGVWRDGKIVAIRYDAVSLEPQIVVSPQTGLRRRPHISSDGRISFETSLTPGLKPGRQISVIDAAGKPFSAGFYRVSSVEHDGDTHSQGLWSSKVVAYPPLDEYKPPGAR